MESDIIEVAPQPGKEGPFVQKITLVFILVLLITLTACSDSAPTPAPETGMTPTPETIAATAPPPANTSEPTATTAHTPKPVAFPQHDYPLGTDQGGDYFAGELVLKEGCLLVEVPTNPNNAPWPARLAIWPSSFSLEQDSGAVRVIDGHGQVAAQVGDHVRVIGAELASEDRKHAELVAGLPEHCPEGRTFVGAVNVFDPKNEVTELRLSNPDVLFLRQETVMAAERVFLTAAGVGELVLDGPCLRIKDEYNTNTVIWPPGFTPHVEDGAIEVRNGAGQTIARVGDEIAGGGGYFESRYKECPGEAFHIHSIKVLPDVEVYFPRWEEEIRKGQVTLPRTGELALDGKCLVLRNILEGDVPNDTFLFWPEAYDLNVGNGVVEVLNKTGRVVARVGDEVEIYAFNVTYGQATKHGGLEEITPACSGGYWAVEEVVPGLMSPQDAVTRATGLAQHLGVRRFGALIGEPSTALGLLTTYGEAWGYYSDDPMSSYDKIDPGEGTPVWVMIFEGEIFAECEQPGCSHLVGPSPWIPEKLEADDWKQVLVVMDAGTGELLLRQNYYVGHLRSTEELEDLGRYLP